MNDLDYVIVLLCLVILSIGLAIKNKFTLQPVNTLVYYAMLLFSLAIANSFSFSSSPLRFMSVFLLCYTVMFLIIETLFFASVAEVTRSDERVASAYQWFDIYLPADKQHNLTEGYFGGRWGDLSASEALRNKFDKIHDMLRLQPGMRVLDVGSGYCLWIEYLKTRGVHGVGLTLSPQQVLECKRRGLTAVVQNVLRYQVKDGDEKYDAITMLGSLEHFTNCFITSEEATRVYRDLFARCARLLKVDSASRRIFISCIHLNPAYSNKGVLYHVHCYLLERHYNGRYPLEGQLAAAAQDAGFRREAYLDTTEDYRWTSIVDKDHFGNFTVKLDTAKRSEYALFMFLTDPYAAMKWMYHACGSWMWQFGGSTAASLADAPKSSTPFRAAFEVFELPKP